MTAEGEITLIAGTACAKNVAAIIIKELLAIKLKAK
jgi:hypothetical protein